MNVLSKIIYVLFEADPYGKDEVKGVFKTKEEAESYAENIKNRWAIHEFELGRFYKSFWERTVHLNDGYTRLKS